MSRLMAQEATIQSATVEIKILTVGGKQMTLSVFRQLPLEGIIDHRTGELKGQPWGRVHYHVHCPERRSPFDPPNRKGEIQPHIHLVWQKDDELRHDSLETLGNYWWVNKYANVFMALDQLFIAV